MIEVLAGNLQTSALLLYYHLATEGWFSHDETVFIDPELFDAFRFLDVEVDEDHSVDIDQTLLREAAVICLLCELNDTISEHEDSFRSTPTVRKIVAAHAEGKLSAVPEASKVLELLESTEKDFDYARYHQVLELIFDQYVSGTFWRLAASATDLMGGRRRLTSSV